MNKISILIFILVVLSYGCETWHHQLWAIENDGKNDLEYKVYLGRSDDSSRVTLIENDTLKSYSYRIFTNYFDLGYSEYTLDTIVGIKNLEGIKVREYYNQKNKAYLLKGIKRQLRRGNYPMIIVQWQELGKKEIKEKRIFYPKQKKRCTDLMLPNGTYLW